MITARAVVLLGVLLAATGCSANSGWDFGGGADDIPAAPPKPRCAGGAAKPFTAAVVARTFRQHGFTVRLLDRDDSCGKDRAVVISNKRGDDSETDDRVGDREGWYTCVLYKRSQTSGYERNLEHEPNSPIGPVHGEWALANVACSYYASDDDHRLDQTRTFDRAMAGLAKLR